MEQLELFDLPEDIVLDAIINPYLLMTGDTSLDGIQEHEIELPNWEDLVVNDHK